MKLDTGGEPGGEGQPPQSQIPQTEVAVKDMTQEEAVHLRRTIYLVLQSSANYEEAVHKVLRLKNVEEREQYFFWIIDFRMLGNFFFFRTLGRSF